MINLLLIILCSFWGIGLLIAIYFQLKLTRKDMDSLSKSFFQHKSDMRLLTEDISQLEWSADNDMLLKKKTKEKEPKVKK